MDDVREANINVIGDRLMPVDRAISIEEVRKVMKK